MYDHTCHCRCQVWINIFKRVHFYITKSIYLKKMSNNYKSNHFVCVIIWRSGSALLIVVICDSHILWWVSSVEANKTVEVTKCLEDRKHLWWWRSHYPRDKSVNSHRDGAIKVTSGCYGDKHWQSQHLSHVFAHTLVKVRVHNKLSALSVGSVLQRCFILLNQPPLHCLYSSKSHVFDMHNPGQ